MKSLCKKINAMEKQALTFLKYGLGAVLYVSIILIIYSYSRLDGAGISSYLLAQELSECITYLLLSLTLVIGGGLFIDYAIKAEKR